jgi:hypothetical protein
MALKENGVVVVALGLVILGSACIFKADPITVWWQRQYYLGGKLVQSWPGFRDVLMSWFLLRFMGMWMWIIAVLLISERFSPKRR